jgi:hypothetical protein
VRRRCAAPRARGARPRDSGAPGRALPNRHNRSSATTLRHRRPPRRRRRRRPDAEDRGRLRFHRGLIRRSGSAASSSLLRRRRHSSNATLLRPPSRPDRNTVALDEKGARAGHPAQSRSAVPPDAGPGPAETRLPRPPLLHYADCEHPPDTTLRTLGR